MGPFLRLSKLMEYLNKESNHNDKTFLYNAIKGKDPNYFIKLDYRSYQEFKVDPIRRSLIHTGRNYNFFGEEYVEEMVNEYTLTEDMCNYLWNSLQKLAMETVEKEYQEKEKLEREREKKTYLNTKLFGKSVAFIMGD